MNIVRLWTLYGCNAQISWQFGRHLAAMTIRRHPNFRAIRKPYIDLVFSRHYEVLLQKVLIPKQNSRHFADDTLKKGNMFLRDQLTTWQHWFKHWHGAEKATNHYLKQCWYFYFILFQIYYVLLTHICVTRSQWVEPNWSPSQRCIIRCLYDNIQGAWWYCK